MALVEKSVLIERSAAQMFALVDTCEDYPLFLPWCERAEIKYRDADKTVATLFVSYRGVRAHFTTENAREAPTRLGLLLVDGPFRRLEGEWGFRPLAENACKIEFRLHYEFSSKLLEKLIGPVFGYIADTFVEAFVRRAESLSETRSHD